MPAHAYPELKKYGHLKGNFGTAWQNQQKEFVNLPAPILFTTNCLMPPKDGYPGVYNECGFLPQHSTYWGRQRFHTCD